jgi:hypothetical protein
MKYEKATFKIKGVSPLLMHNGQTADPMNYFAKEIKKISGKKAKVEADYREMSRLEFQAGLYLQDGAVVIPGRMVEAAFIKGAMKSKRGPAAKAGVFIDEDFPLIYDGPTDPNALFEDDNFKFIAAVIVQRNRVMRTRPMFRDWSANITVSFLEDQLNPSAIKDIMKTVGELIGYGDWRPKFGRFEIVGD